MPVLSHLSGPGHVVRLFVTALNKKQIDVMGGFLPNNHQLVIAGQITLEDKNASLDYWTALFKKKPNYKIEVVDMVVNNNRVLLFGRIKGAPSLLQNILKGKNMCVWEILLSGDKITHWKEFHNPDDFFGFRKTDEKQEGE